MKNNKKSKKMNVGVYSFYPFDLKRTSLYMNFINGAFETDKVFLYTENTNKQRLSCREGYKRLIEDYQNKKINFIVFEDLDALGSDSNVCAEILKDMIDKRCQFSSLEGKLTNMTGAGEFFISFFINFNRERKKEQIRRSIAGEIHKQNKNTTRDFYTG